jgi:hypothetical protein
VNRLMRALDPHDKQPAEIIRKLAREVLIHAVHHIGEGYEGPHIRARILTTLLAAAYELR